MVLLRWHLQYAMVTLLEKFHLDQQYMRVHLIECLEKKQFMMFPIRKAHWQGSKIKSSEIVPVHCICHMPEIKQVSMIQSGSHCKQWYHGRHCVKTCLAPRSKVALP